MNVTGAVAAVLTEEMRRQNRKPGEVCVSAGVNKNALYKVRDGGGLKVETLAALAKALGVPFSEVAFRVERLLATDTLTGATHPRAHAYVEPAEPMRWTRIR